MPEIIKQFFAPVQKNTVRVLINIDGRVWAVNLNEKEGNEIVDMVDKMFSAKGGKRTQERKKLRKAI